MIQVQIIFTSTDNEPNICEVSKILARKYRTTKGLQEASNKCDNFDWLDCFGLYTNDSDNNTVVLHLKWNTVFRF